MKAELRTRCKAYLLIIIFILVALNWTLVIRLDEFKKTWPRFTYQDWLILYEICNKKWWSKEKKIQMIYWETETDFKKFLLSK